MNNLRSDILSILAEAGIEDRIPRDMVAIAQGFLDNKSIDAESTTIQTSIDPENGITRVDVNFYIVGTVKEVMELDFELTKIFIQHFPHIPYEFSITLTPEESICQLL